MYYINIKVRRNTLKYIENPISQVGFTIAKIFQSHVRHKCHTKRIVLCCYYVDFHHSQMFFVNFLCTICHVLSLAFAA